MPYPVRPTERRSSPAWAVPAAGASPAVSVIIVMAVARPAVRIAYRMSPPAPASEIPRASRARLVHDQLGNIRDVPHALARQTTPPPALSPLITVTFWLYAPCAPQKCP